MTKRILIAATLAAAGLAACSPSKGASAPAAPVASAPAAAPAAATPTAEDARAWLKAAYDHYKQPDFSPFTKPADWFDPALSAAIDEDARLTPEGEVGAVDGDPICNCQDPMGLKADIGEVRLISPTTAQADVALDFSEPGGPTAPPRHIKVDLTAVNGQWRIHDVTEGSESFLTYLKDANAKARKAAAH